MKKLVLSLFGLSCAIAQSDAQMKLTPQIALDLSRLPLHCITTEFPNKTQHLADAPDDARLLPSELHPVFFGCLDWHSSVHGHWMLVRLLQTYPNIENRDSIIAILNNSFQKEKIVREADYFGKYTGSQNYERTYGWAWLLKLDEALGRSKDSMYVQWHEALRPLTEKIVAQWKAFLPKNTYPNRTGVHPNTAFGLSFALDWAMANKDETFAQAIKKKAIEFYGDNKNIPAYLEPDGSDFFSPSLMAASLMSKVYDRTQFQIWFKKYYSQQSLNRICSLPTVSDRSDYQIVHLDGLSFSRAWCMRVICKHLDNNDPLKKRLLKTSDMFLEKALPQVFGGYGGEHWLASFAIYALLET